MRMLKFILAVSLLRVNKGEVEKEFFITPKGLKFIAGVLSENISSELLDGNLQFLKGYHLKSEDLKIFVLNLKITDIQTPEPDIVTAEGSGLKLKIHDMSLEMEFRWRVKKGEEGHSIDFGTFSAMIKKLNFDLSDIEELIPKFKGKIPEPLKSVTGQFNDDFQDSITFEVIKIVIQSLNTVLN